MSKHVVIKIFTLFFTSMRKAVDSIQGNNIHSLRKCFQPGTNEHHRLLLVSPSYRGRVLFWRKSKTTPALLSSSDLTGFTFSACDLRLSADGCTALSVSFIESRLEVFQKHTKLKLTAALFQRLVRRARSWPSPTESSGLAGDMATIEELSPAAGPVSTRPPEDEIDDDEDEDVSV